MMDEDKKQWQKKDIQHLLRSIPSVEILAQELDHHGLPQPIVNSIIRDEVDGIRLKIKESQKPLPFDIRKSIQEAILRSSRQRIQKVLNGTGVILHTNLGRAPMNTSVAQHIAKVAQSYCNLEFDISNGNRGKRGLYAEKLLKSICQSEAATLVNNCAAALVLILKELISDDRKEVIISRGELVQIGGGFRIPEILETSGARLKEVGTTNKTTLSDYEKAIGSETALILKVHQSNFAMEGFVESPTRSELSALATDHNVPLIEDLGSGAITQTQEWKGTPNEPTPELVIKSGVDLVCFSGDKLFGGPQAGVIAGKENLIKRIKSNPFFRCLRCDKLILSGIEYTAESYLKKSFRENVLIHSIGNPTEQAIKERADLIVKSIRSNRLKCSIQSTFSTVGGGTLPKARIPSFAIELSSKELSSSKLQLALLHQCEPPVTSKIEDQKLLIDLRTISPDDDDALIQLISDLEGKIK